MERFVVVAVEQHQVSATEHGVCNDLVGGAGAIENEISLVRSEDLRGMPLSLHGRAFMDQQVAEIDIRVAQIVTEDALAEVLEEELPSRGLAIELTALMSRAIEGDVCFPIIGH